MQKMQKGHYLIVEPAKLQYPLVETQVEQNLEEQESRKLHDITIKEVAGWGLSARPGYFPKMIIIFY